MDDRRWEFAKGGQEPGVAAPVSPSTPCYFGREWLRAYVLVYCTLAFKLRAKGACSRPGSQQGVQPGPSDRLTLDAMHNLLTSLEFLPGEPGDGTATNGYSPSCDVLWVFLHREVNAPETKFRTRLGTPEQMLAKGKPVDNKLRSFLGSLRLLRWRRSPRPVASLPKRTQVGLRMILGEVMPEALAFRGHALIGHGKEVKPRGLYLIGVRSHDWLVGASQAERLAWLRLRPDLVRPFALPPLGKPEDLSLLLRKHDRPSVAALGGALGGLRPMARTLLAYHEERNGNPWRWRKRQVEDWDEEVTIEEIRFGGSVFPVCFLGQVHDVTTIGEKLRLALLHYHSARPAGDRVTLVVATGLGPDEMARILCVTATPEGRHEPDSGRFLVVDRTMIEALARRYPWVWLLELFAVRAGAAWLPFRDVPHEYFVLAMNLRQRGHPDAEREALQYVLSVPRLRLSVDEFVIALDDLPRVEALDPWRLLRDLMRVQRRLWRSLVRATPDEVLDDLMRSERGLWQPLIRERRALRTALGLDDMDEVVEDIFRLLGLWNPFMSGNDVTPGDWVRWAWWIPGLLRLILDAVPSSAWVSNSPPNRPSQRALSRLLTIWRAYGDEEGARWFADAIRTALTAAGASTTAVDRAWDECYWHPSLPTKKP